MNMPRSEKALSMHDSTVYVCVYDRHCMTMSVYKQSRWIMEGIYWAGSFQELLR